MNALKHTPGPWVVVAEANEYGNQMDTWLVRGPYRSVIAQPRHRPHNFADAHLMAASPTMYEALEQCPLPSTMGNVDTHYQRFYDWYNKSVVPALAAARGEASE